MPQDQPSGIDTEGRNNLRRILADFGVTTARRALNSSSTEEVILLSETDYSTVDVDALHAAVAAALPGTKVGLVKQTERWRTEPL